MLPQKDRTLDVYKEAGAAMRLYKTLGVKTYAKMSHVLNAKDREKMRRALSMIDEICNCADENLGKDFPVPEPNTDYMYIFYGSTTRYPFDDFDTEIITLARKKANQLFNTLFLKECINNEYFSL